MTFWYWLSCCQRSTAVGGTGFREYIDFRFGQPSDTHLMISETELPGATEVRPVQHINVIGLMVVTEFGITTSVRFVHKDTKLTFFI